MLQDRLKDWPPGLSRLLDCAVLILLLSGCHLTDVQVPEIAATIGTPTAKVQDAIPTAQLLAQLPEPRDCGQWLENLEAAIDYRLFEREDFYRQSNLIQVFGDIAGSSDNDAETHWDTLSFKAKANPNRLTCVDSLQLKHDTSHPWKTYALMATLGNTSQWPTDGSRNISIELNRKLAFMQTDRYSRNLRLVYPGHEYFKDYPCPNEKFSTNYFYQSPDASAHYWLNFSDLDDKKDLQKEPVVMVLLVTADPPDPLPEPSEAVPTSQLLAALPVANDCRAWLHSLKAAIDNRLFDREDFYRLDNLQQVFGGLTGSSEQDLQKPWQSLNFKAQPGGNSPACIDSLRVTHEVRSRLEMYSLTMNLPASPQWRTAKGGAAEIVSVFGAPSDVQEMRAGRFSSHDAPYEPGNAYSMLYIYQLPKYSYWLSFSNEYPKESKTQPGAKQLNSLEHPLSITFTIHKRVAQFSTATTRRSTDALLASLPPAASCLDQVRNFKRAAEQKLFFNSDFYTEANLRRFLGDRDTTYHISSIFNAESGITYDSATFNDQEEAKQTTGLSEVINRSSTGTVCFSRVTFSRYKSNLVKADHRVSLFLNLMPTADIEAQNIVALFGEPDEMKLDDAICRHRTVHLQANPEDIKECSFRKSHFEYSLTRQFLTYSYDPDTEFKIVYRTDVNSRIDQIELSIVE